MGRGWRIAAMLLSLVVWVGCLTGAWLAMRAVMGVAGGCAPSGPDALPERCPSGSSWLLFAGSLVGVVALWAYVTANRPLPGPRLERLAWCALFLGVGATFLQFALAPPVPVTYSTVTTVVWVMCGALFLVLGGVPLVLWLGVASQRRSILWADADPSRGKAALAAAQAGGVVLGIVVGVAAARALMG